MQKCKVVVGCLLLWVKSFVPGLIAEMAFSVSFKSILVGHMFSN